MCLVVVVVVVLILGDGRPEVIYTRFVYNVIELNQYCLRLQDDKNRCGHC